MPFYKVDDFPNDRMYVCRLMQYRDRDCSTPRGWRSRSHTRTLSASIVVTTVSCPLAGNSCKHRRWRALLKPDVVNHHLNADVCCMISSDLPTQSAHQRRVTVAREKRFKRKLRALACSLCMSPVTDQACVTCTAAGHVRTSSSHMELKSAGAAVAQAKRTGGTGGIMQFFQGPNRDKTPESP